MKLNRRQMAIVQMVLMISLSFAIAFIWSENTGDSFGIGDIVTVPKGQLVPSEGVPMGTVWNNIPGTNQYKLTYFKDLTSGGTYVPPGGPGFAGATTSAPAESVVTLRPIVDPAVTNTPAMMPATSLDVAESEGIVPSYVGSGGTSASGLAAASTPVEATEGVAPFYAGGVGAPAADMAGAAPEIPSAATGPGTYAGAGPSGLGVGGLGSTVTGGSSLYYWGAKDVVSFGGKSFTNVPVWGQGNALYANLPGQGNVMWSSSSNSWVAAGADAPKLPAAGTAGGTSGTGGATGILDTLYGGALGGAPGALLSGAMWAVTVGFVGYFLGKMFGMTPNNAKALGYAGATAAGVWSTLHLLGTNGVISQSGFMYTWAPVIGIGLGVGVFLYMYKTEKQELVTFECYPWEAPLGGARCEECNKDPMKPCSEYRCKSLGQSCAIVNKGSANELCVNVNKGDVSAPIMTPWVEALRPVESKLKYVPDTSIRPPNTGVKIISGANQGGCLKAYTRLQFGLTTNEPAQCKIDFSMGQKFADMSSLFGDTNLYEYNHTQELKVPAPENSENGSGLTIPNQGTWTLWTRCRDANGNENPDAFAFRFCVDPSPDTSQPIIESTSVEDGAPVAFGTDRVPIELQVNEPAQCKWSRTDKDYGSMENMMSCDTNTYAVNSQLNYVCSGDLTGIKDRADNQFCFRCVDSSNNVMSTSKCITLKGTEEMIITGVRPSNETLTSGETTAQVPLQVKTEHGADDGLSSCYYSPDGKTENEVLMDMEPTYFHNMTIDLGAGNYQYFFRCTDAGGNTARANTTFSVVIDNVPPVVTRIYRNGDKMEIITNKASQCVYSLTSCNYNFADALQNTPMIPTDATTKIVHSVDWKPENVYYIKCADMNNKQPSVAACSIVARGSEL